MTRREARILWRIERHRRKDVAARLGVHRRHLNHLLWVYCPDAGSLLSDCDEAVLRARRGPGRPRSDGETPAQLARRIQAAGPSEAGT